MWIRSQSRKALLNVNQVVIIPSVDKRMYFICNSLEKESVTLGVYLTEEDTLNKLGYKAKINTHTTSYIN